MTLVKNETKVGAVNHAPLEALLKPTNQYIVSSIDVTTLKQGIEASPITELGTVQYDERQIRTISSFSEGRIDRLYVKYKYQLIRRGEKILDLYSPELVTAEENYLFLLKQDKENSSLIKASKQRLLLLGMSAKQIGEISTSGKPLYAVSLYSNYSGIINDASINPSMVASQNSSQGSPSNYSSQELIIKEGMYLTKGQAIFTIINLNKALIALNIYSNDQNRIKVGDLVKITPETGDGKSFSGKIGLIDPFYKTPSKTLTSRVYFDNSSLHLPIGSRVHATLFSYGLPGFWLPESSVLTLGFNHIVFKKEGVGFSVHKVFTGEQQNGKIQITAGLSLKDSVAINAQFLIGSESAIQVKE
ncbi:MAG: efflux RND transporter periplasmic adaptor subunit [Flavisolibacter sp.]